MLRRRFWAEMVTAISAMVFALLALISRDWIELFFRVDPDRESGSFEWLIAAVLFVMSVASFLLARYEWRKASPATT